MADLGPKIYSRNSKLQILTRNAYDTVHMQPIPNATEDTPTTVFTQEITSGDVAGNVVSFPITNTVAPTFMRAMYNRHVAIVNEYTYAKARIEATVATGTVDVVLDQPIVGTPVAELVLRGHSYSVDKLSKTYDELPDSGNAVYTQGFTNWIQENCAKVTSLKKNYNVGDVSLNPWVSRIFSYPELTPTENVDVAWSDGSMFSNEANVFKWFDSSYGNASTTGPYTIIDASVNDYNLGLTMKDQKTSILATVAKISDTHFKVNWQAPIRYAYMAASRKQHTITGAWTDIDNLIYMDVIESVTVNIKATKINTEVVDTYYSLDSKDRLTTVAKNGHIYTLEPSEILTLETYEASFEGKEPWVPKLAKQILLQSKNGKYIFECEVPATWAYAHKIKSRSVYYIIQQNGEYVKRKTSTGIERIQFEVVNILKYYAKDRFIYRLKLIQV